MKQKERRVSDESDWFLVLFFFLSHFGGTIHILFVRPSEHIAYASVNTSTRKLKTSHWRLRYFCMDSVAYAGTAKNIFFINIGILRSSLGQQ